MLRIYIGCMNKRIKNLKQRLNYFSAIMVHIYKLANTFLDAAIVLIVWLKLISKLVKKNLPLLAEQ